MSKEKEEYFTELKDGELAVRTLEQSGSIIPEDKKDPKRYVTALVQTDNGKQLCVKTYPLGGGGGGGGSTNIVTLTTESTELATNTIYNGGELASVTLTLPDSVPVDFIAQVEFTSGATATTFTAPATLYFNGDACEGGVFTPTASKRYCILIISDGVNVLGFVYEK